MAGLVVLFLVSIIIGENDESKVEFLFFGQRHKVY